MTFSIERNFPKRLKRQQLSIGMSSGYHGAMRVKDYRKGKRAVVVAGIALGMVLVVGFLYWKDFLVRYHVIRLRADPAYLRTAILEPEGSAAQLAVSLFLQTEEGKDRLARAYFDACKTWIGRFQEGGQATAIFQVEGHLCVGRVPGPGGGSGELRNTERDRFIRSCAPFLPPLRGRSFRLEKDPGFQVTFLPADEVYSSLPADDAVSRIDLYIRVTRITQPGSGPPAGVPMEAPAAMKAATALLIEPVTNAALGVLPGESLPSRPSR